MGLMLILPPSPVLEVAAEIVVFSAMVRFWVSMLMIPALPAPVVSTVILPSPVMSIVSGANMLMLPPSPLAVVRAEMKPESVKVMLMSGSVLAISASPCLPVSPSYRG